MYSIRILEQAVDELARLDKPVAKRVSKRIRWLAENLATIHPERLKGSLSGLYKLRVGDYRVIYQIIKSEKTVVIHLIGHRREIYKSSK